MGRRPRIVEVMSGILANGLENRGENLLAWVPPFNCSHSASACLTRIHAACSDADGPRFGCNSSVGVAATMGIN